MQGIDLGEQYVDENKITFPNAIAIFDGNAGIKIEYLNANNIGVTTEYEINNNKISSKDKIIYIEEHNESVINDILKTIKIKIYKKIEVKITLIKNNTNYMPLGTVATADKSYQDNTPDKAIDTNLETRWWASDYRGKLNLRFKNITNINGVQLKVDAVPTAKNTYILKYNGYIIGQKTLIVEQANLTTVDIDVINGNYNEIEIECKSEGLEGSISPNGSWISIYEVLLSDKEELASDTCIITNLGDHIQVIDEHTLLYLKAEDFTDSSFNNIDITPGGTQVIDDGYFGKCFNFTNINQRLRIPDGSYKLNDEWTIDFRLYMNSLSTPTSFDILGKGYYQGGVNNGFVVRIESNGSMHVLLTNGSAIIKRVVALAGAIEFKTWQHICIIYKNCVLSLYIDGKFISSLIDNDVDINGTGKDLILGCGWETDSTRTSNHRIDEFRISNVARWTENFEVPTEPYDYPCKIEILEQTEHHINFRVLINTTTVNKVKVYVNNEIEKEYIDTFENLVFDIIYDEKYIIGKNEIKFVVEYNENKNIEEKVDHYRHRIDENTMFFLNGTDVVDSSYNPKVINNNGVTMSEGGKFGKFYNMKTGYLQIQNFNPHFRNFSIEFYLKFNDNSTQDILFDTRVSSYNKGYLIYTESKKLRFYLSEYSYSSIDYSNFDKSVYHHFAFEIKDYKYIKIYHNGILKKTDTLSEIPQEHASNNIYMSKRCDGGNYRFTNELSMFRISNMNIYNENFTPTNILYCYEPILKAKQASENQLILSINDKSNVMNKLEIFINDSLKETIVDNFNNISFNLLLDNYNDGFNEFELLMTFNNVRRIIKRFKIYKADQRLILASKCFEVNNILFDKIYTHFKPFFLGHGSINILYSTDDNEFTYCDINTFTQINSNNIRLMFLMDSDAVIEAYKIYVKDCIDTTNINFNEVLPPPNNIDKFPVTGGEGLSEELFDAIKSNFDILNNKILEEQKYIKYINDRIISVEDKVYDIEFDVDEYHKNTNLKHNQLTDTLINDKYIKQLIDCELDINNDNVK
ncbi:MULTISPECIES: LamG domain-containing protein [unclassified Clostridioides]|uniref:LamG domain-containing protein n=1 Tax=unclassified Clostridioides TaxID=2635829 RepID=UPI001D13051B|nr:laminin G domain-containing protein [Clostridioides sp. ES-S-0049-03]MCC0675361.1 laminin G domain-containing protein [Clostridioides sp. ES-W-0018-02]MCC0709830.1 laminin G domain-containing protein [Clostridioides sp. ES-W-0017-02]